MALLRERGRVLAVLVVVSGIVLLAFGLFPRTTEAGLRGEQIMHNELAAPPNAGTKASTATPTRVRNKTPKANPGPPLTSIPLQTAAPTATLPTIPPGKIGICHRTNTPETMPYVFMIIDISEIPQYQANGDIIGVTSQADCPTVLPENDATATADAARVNTVAAQTLAAATGTAQSTAVSATPTATQSVSAAATATPTQSTTGSTATATLTPVAGTTATQGANTETSPTAVAGANTNTPAVSATAVRVTSTKTAQNTTAASPTKRRPSRTPAPLIPTGGADLNVYATGTTQAPFMGLALLGVGLLGLGLAKRQMNVGAVQFMALVALGLSLSFLALIEYVGLLVISWGLGIIELWRRR